MFHHRRPPPVGVGGGADAAVVPLVPVELVVPAAVAGAGPVRHLVPAGTGGREHLVGQRVPVRPGRPRRDGGRIGGQRRARLHGEGVGAHVARRRFEGEHGLQAVAEVVVGLAGPAEDEVDVDRGEAGRTGQGHGPADRRRGHGAGPARPARGGPWTATPNETRFTPAARHTAKRGAEASSGLHSTVTSAPSSAGDGVEDRGQEVGRAGATGFRRPRRRWRPGAWPRRRGPARSR